LKDFEVIDRKDKLFDIIKFKSNFLKFFILNLSFSGLLERLAALCLANISVIVLSCENSAIEKSSIIVVNKI
jgi:hypothetical protein